MGFPEITQALKRETEAWNAHDADGVAACYAEDAVLYDVGLPDTVQGRAAIRESVAGYLAALSALHVDVRDPIRRPDSPRRTRGWPHVPARCQAARRRRARRPRRNRQRRHQRRVRSRLLSPA